MNIFTLFQLTAFAAAITADVFLQSREEVYYGLTCRRFSLKYDWLTLTNDFFGAKTLIKFPFTITFYRTVIFQQFLHTL